MSELVVDASALVAALTGRSSIERALRDRLRVSVCHAPHLIDAEIGNVLRRLVRAGDISAEYGLTALRASTDVIDERHPHYGVIAEQAWRMRNNITFYDGMYVALASQLGLPLLTGDRRLAQSPDLGCIAELV